MSNLYRVTGPDSYEQSLRIYGSWKSIPDGLRTRGQWRKKDRKVRKGEKPVALIRWTEMLTTHSKHQHSDGSVTWSQEPHDVVRTGSLFCREQTDTFQPRPRTHAREIFRQYFVRFSSHASYIWRCGNEWKNCSGKVTDWHLKLHETGRGIYGVKAGEYTRWGAIDLDLHDGDRAVFLDQLRAVLGEFHGKDGWHLQVADKDAQGVHLLHVFPDAIHTSTCVGRIRHRLQLLDGRHPELTTRAKQAGMPTLAELEVYPSLTHGFRLPLCKDRTMLLDEPLPRVWDKRLDREVADILGYIMWLRKPTAYMPADDVMAYVEARLAHPEAAIRELNNVSQPAGLPGRR